MKERIIVGSVLVLLWGAACGSTAFSDGRCEADGDPDCTLASSLHDSQYALDGGAPAKTVLDTTIVLAPNQYTNSAQASFAFGSNAAGAAYEYSIDGNKFVTTALGSLLELKQLKEGTHVLKVRARGASGEVDFTPATHVWTVDLTPPETTLSSAPGKVMNDNLATFNLATETGATFECSLDGRTYSSCETPLVLFDLDRGQHVLEVRAVDAAGNQDKTPVNYQWFVRTPVVRSGGLIGNMCAIASTGEITCWGFCVAGRCPEPPVGTFRNLHLFNDSGCGINEQFQLSSCWGDARNPMEKGPFVAMSGGGSGWCALRPAGTLACWGSSPSTFGTGMRFREISRPCGILEDGTMLCESNRFFAKTPVAIPGNYRGLSGTVITCAAKVAGGADCWHTQGVNPFEPYPTPALPEVRAIASGTAYGCAITMDRKLTCWNILGGGRKGTAPAYTPEGEFVSIVAETTNVCGVRADLSVACWSDSARTLATMVPAPK